MNKKMLSLFLCMIFIASSLSAVAIEESNNIKISNKIETSSYIVLHVDDALNIASNLRADGFDILFNTVTETSFELIVTPQELKLLQMRGFKPEILSRGRPFAEIQKERQSDPLFVPPGYLDLSEIIEEMEDAESAYPSICKVYDLTETYNVSPTYEDRHIYAMKISDNVSEDEDEPNFLMVSCHHAREIVTPVIALYAIEQFTSEYGNDPDITTAVDDYEIWISPVWNPDGYEHCYYYDNWWRKNRNLPDGVDLNRNYPFGWDSWCSGSTDPYSETYKGPSTASEAETQTMMVFTDDRHFAKVLDYHSHGREVLYGYCCHSHPFSSFFYSEAVSLSTAAGYGGSVRDPSAEGEHYEWQIWNNGTYANLMETHTEFQPSYSSAVAEATQVWFGTMWLLERPISVSGHITDSYTGEPFVVSIKIVDVNFENGEKFISEPKFGRYHLFLPPGTYELEFSHENYQTQTHEVTVTTTSAEILDVELAIINDPPNKPTIKGPSFGKVGDELEFTFNATDPDEDDIEYHIDWDDGKDEWIGPYNSGEEVTKSHIWDTQGIYVIKAKARDIYGEESDLGFFQVTIEKRSRSLLRELHFLRPYFLRFFTIFNIIFNKYSNIR